MFKVCSTEEEMMCQWREARKMRLSLTIVRCFQRPLWVFFPLASCSWSHRRPCYQPFIGVGGLDQSQYGNTRPHLPTEANSQKRPLGIQDRTWLGKFHPPPPWKRSHTYFLRKGPLVLCGPGRPESVYVDEADLELLIFLAVLSKCWGYKHVPTHWTKQSMMPWMLELESRHLLMTVCLKSYKSRHRLKWAFKPSSKN